ncbi:hypothetical protein [Massilia antarctica]|uniref:hypothetical protein n=1 Tax=Massilia antarctica TaxID=2765360 RepID=UPI001E2BF330|nr:hypothetical protein [Massilia antarctica]
MSHAAPHPMLPPLRPLRSYLCGALLLAACGLAGAAEPPASPWNIGGAVRVNYVYKSWQPEYRHGFIGLDTLRLDVKYDDEHLIGSAQYRYNHFPAGQGGYTNNFLHHGWAGVRFADKSELHVGLDKVPFGLLPFASNNFFESIAYYLGLEDTYALGINYAWRSGPVAWRLAYFARDGGSYGGGGNTARASNRYSFNLVPDDDKLGYGTGQGDRERDTLVARAAWHAPGEANTELGLSLLSGAIHSNNGARSRRRAAAIHAKGSRGPWTMMAEALYYHNDTRHLPGQTFGGLDPNSFVILGAFGYPYPVAAKGVVYVANVSYDIAGSAGPFTGFKIYNDYSVLKKKTGGFKDSLQNVTGLSFSSGKWMFYADVMLAKHQPYMSPDFGGLAATSPLHDGFSRRFNLQAGYYF